MNAAQLSLWITLAILCFTKTTLINIGLYGGKEIAKEPSPF